MLTELNSASASSRVKLFYVPLLIWTIFIIASVTLNIRDLERAHQSLVIDRARSFFEIIVMQRSWNARHGGVYVAVTKDVLPNPYLDDALRDLTSLEGIKLTKVNPAYMTRQLGEIAKEQESTLFNITSLKPIRPDNRANTWESNALMQFEQGRKEKFELIETASMKRFMYMAPLLVEEACLKCHAKQGYKLGDVRGGISISFPARTILEANNAQENRMILIHFGIFISGVLTIIFIYRISKQAEEALFRLSIQDGLTGLFNRRYFNKVMENEWKRAMRESTVLSAIMIDIDFFKQYNDTYGHQAGDCCLKMISALLDKSFNRAGDMLARYGGEEFLALLPNTDYESTLDIARSICRNVEAAKKPHEGSSIN
ncbi:MAG: diguanylate cyclase, partial [Thermodesulfovibrionales bacterium]|nr:diguanylate cyclase [Thermodesulfovibrionales bacterium]